MSHYTNLENYCNSCRYSSDDDYGTIQSYCSEGFTNQPRKIVVNPQPQPQTTVIPEFYKIVVNPGKPTSEPQKSNKIKLSTVGLL